MKHFDKLFELCYVGESTLFHIQDSFADVSTICAGIAQAQTLHFVNNTELNATRHCRSLILHCSSLVTA